MIKTGYTVDLDMIFRCKGFFGLIGFLLVTSLVNAQEIINVPQGSGMKEILVLPASWIIDSNYKELGAVRSERVKKNDDNADFDPQLEKLAIKVAAKGGNVLQLSRIEDHKQSGNYRFWGDAYHTDKYEQIKSKIAASRNNKFSEPCSYIILYRPAYSLGFNDSLRFEVVINDTLSLYMQSNTRYILKVRKAGKIRMTVKHKGFVQNLNMDVKTGNEYFVRSYTNFPGAGKYLNTGDIKLRVRGYTPYLEKVEDPVQGNVESSMVTQIVVTKKI